MKTVDEQDRVVFLPVRVARSTSDGLWVTGIPKGTRVITVGQGFVRAGDKVIAVDERDIADGAAAN